MRIDHSKVAMINKTLREYLSPKIAQKSELIAPMIKNREFIRVIAPSLFKLRAIVNSSAIGVIILNKAEEKRVNKINIFIKESFLNNIYFYQFIDLRLWFLSI